MQSHTPAQDPNDPPQVVSATAPTSQPADPLAQAVEEYIRRVSGARDPHPSDPSTTEMEGNAIPLFPPSATVYASDARPAASQPAPDPTAAAATTTAPANPGSGITITHDAAGYAASGDTPAVPGTQDPAAADPALQRPIAPSAPAAAAGAQTPPQLAAVSVRADSTAPSLAPPDPLAPSAPPFGNAAAPSGNAAPPARGGLAEEADATRPQINAPAVAAHAPASLRDLLDRLPPGDDSFREQLDRRLLAVVAGDFEQARRPLNLVTAEQQELTTRYVESLIAIRDWHMGDPSGAVTAAAGELESLQHSLGRLSELSVPVVKICSAVRGFGQYDAIDPPRLLAGSNAEFVLYAEVRNFVSEAEGQGTEPERQRGAKQSPSGSDGQDGARAEARGTAAPSGAFSTVGARDGAGDGKDAGERNDPGARIDPAPAGRLFVTRFDLTTTILNRIGDAVLELKDADVVDRCRNRRHDCFIPRLVRLPPTLPPGHYVAKITVADKLGRKVAENRATFQLVARE